jgi:uncharacterized protein (DUF58 family)
MSRNAIVVLVLFALSLLGARGTGRTVFYSLSYLWGGVLVVSFLWSRLALRGVTLERMPRSTRSQVGHLLIERFILHNESRIPKVWVEVRDESNLPGRWAASLIIGGRSALSGRTSGHRASSVLLGLTPNHVRVWLARTLCTQRGVFRLGPAVLGSGDPFGLFPVTREVRETANVIVLPQTVPILGFPTPSGRLPGGDALQQRTHQVTTNAAGVRDYAPGDSLNRIHWRSTARQRKLIVKEFELDPMAEMWLVLDASGATQRALAKDVEEQEEYTVRAFRRNVQIPLPPSTEEYGVSIAASLATHMMERDRAVGFAAYGRRRHVIQADRGASQLNRILETLAVLDAVGTLSLEQLIRLDGQRIPRGSTVIVITPDSSPEVPSWINHLRRTGRSPVLVLLDAESFGGAPGSISIASAVRRLGVIVKVIRRGDSLETALSSGPGARRFVRAA